MRYCSENARNIWPNEVIPISGWYNPVKAMFGEYEIQILPKKELEWYLSKSFGSNWKNYDGNGKKIVNYDCLLHTSKLNLDHIY